MLDSVVCSYRSLFDKHFPSVRSVEQAWYTNGCLGGLRCLCKCWFNQREADLLSAGLLGAGSSSHRTCFSEVCGDIQRIPNALDYGMLLLPTEFLQPSLGNENKLTFWLFVWV